MKRTPLTLAALATGAVRGLRAVAVRPAPTGTGDDDAAIVTDDEGQQWFVRAPTTPAAGVALEAELALLHTLAPYVDAGVLPFAVPRPAGLVALREGGHAVVHTPLPGASLELERLGPGPGLAADLGRSVAAVHELPHAVVADAGLPVYEADEYRRRRLGELDEAAATGHVPPVLLRRWEEALSDVALWRFSPTVVHGDLGADHVHVAGTRVRGVSGWSQARVSDPADDLAWLLVAAPAEAVDSVLEAYRLRRTELSDPHLETRALLAGELELVRWLMHGMRTHDAAVVDDAVEMLLDLEAALDPALSDG